MKVCIAEKPSVAAEIAKVLGATRKESGFWSGNDYCVTWVFGHLCELKEPHDYSSNLKHWDAHDLPIIPQRFGIKLKEDSGVKRQFHIINQLVSKAEVVINCGDAGQEGELIQRWVMQLANVKCPVLRLWISSLTEESIREGFANLRNGSEFDSLYAAGSARAIGDWLLGMNATRAYTLRYGGRGVVLSIGRVQTPTLSLIVSRYLEIQNFVPEKYWELKTKYRDVVFSTTTGKFDKIEDANAALATIEDKPFFIDDVVSKNGKEAPPSLFDLTSLQVECNNKLGLSAEDTLRIAQTLYENKFTTYPRVDTRFLTDDIYPKVPGILKGLTPYANLVAPLLSQGKLPKSKRVFNNLKVTDHHAIIPTGVPPSPSLQPNEKKVFDMIARRFIANFYPESTVSLTTVSGHSESVKFKANGKVIVDPAWRVVYGQQKLDEDNKEDAGVLPNFVVGESGPHQPSVLEKQTQPPKPYTEASLLRAMETAGKQVEDPELKELMKENGIGRPSTRAAIIETLYKRHYIVKERKALSPTVNGIRLIQTISSPILKSVEMTGNWEKKLRQIEKSEFSTAQFIEEMKQMVFEVVQNVFADNVTARFEQIAPRKASKLAQSDVASSSESKLAKPAKSSTAKELICPSCGKPLLAGRAAWGCSGYKEGCRFVIPFECFGKKLSEAQALSLTKKGETSVIKGLLVDGEKKDGKLAFGDTFQLVYKPVEAKQAPDISAMACPICGGKILAGRTAWGCSNYSQGCRFVVPYEFMGKKLTPTHLSVLAKKRRTSALSGFVDEHGISREGSLVVSDNGVVILEEKSR